MIFLKTARLSSKKLSWCPSASILVLAACLLSAPGFAQDGDDSDSGWVRQFDSVTVEQVDPGDLPTTVRPGAQTTIRTDSDELPKPATQEDLRKIVEHVDARMVQVVSVQTPPRPYRQVPMVHYGHALWISASKGAKPVLVSPLHWLQEADAVYIMPADLDAKAEVSWKTRQRTLESVTAGDRGEKWLDEHRKKLIPVEPHRPDKHRNLVTLVVGEQDDDQAKKRPVSIPPSGLELFDVDNKALFRLYGYTPFFGKSLTQTSMLPTHPDDDSLAFYWQTSYPAILGAPLMSQDGKLVAINALRHPAKEDRFLAIPTGAIASYLKVDDEDTAEKDTPETKTPDTNK
jgi:hypothetical protein